MNQYVSMFHCPLNLQATSLETQRQNQLHSHLEVLPTMFWHLLHRQYDQHTVGYPRKRNSERMQALTGEELILGFELSMDFETNDCLPMTRDAGDSRAEISAFPER